MLSAPEGTNVYSFYNLRILFILNMGPISIYPLLYVELVQCSANLCFSNARYTLVISITDEEMQC